MNDTMNSTSARENLSEVLNRVAYAKDRVRITRRGKAVAAVVPIEDLELIEQIEDQIDIREAKKALADARSSGESRNWNPNPAPAMPRFSKVPTTPCTASEKATTGLSTPLKMTNSSCSSSASATEARYTEPSEPPHHESSFVLSSIYPAHAPSKERPNETCDEYWRVRRAIAIRPTNCQG